MIIHDLVSAFGCRSDRNASEKLKQMFRIRVSRAGFVMLILFGTLPLTSRTGGAVASAQTAQQQQTTVSGNVTDATGEPLIGVTVLVEAARPERALLPILTVTTN